MQRAGIFVGWINGGFTVILILICTGQTRFNKVGTYPWMVGMSSNDETHVSLFSYT